LDFLIIWNIPVNSHNTRTNRFLRRRREPPPPIKMLQNESYFSEIGYFASASPLKI
jgi:hypothetical protein